MAEAKLAEEEAAFEVSIAAEPPIEGGFAPTAAIGRWHFAMYNCPGAMTVGGFMSIEKPDGELFYRLETSLHRPEVRASPQQVADLLADEFVEFGKSGRVYNKQVMVDALAKETSLGSLIVPKVTDFSATSISSNVVLVTYRSVRALPNEIRSSETLRSSLWKLASGRWQMVFHQGTPVTHE